MIADPTARERNGTRSRLALHTRRSRRFQHFSGNQRLSRPSASTSATYTPEPHLDIQVHDARRAAEGRVGQVSVVAQARARRVSQPPRQWRGDVKESFRSVTRAMRLSRRFPRAAYPFREPPFDERLSFSARAPVSYITAFERARVMLRGRGTRVRRRGAGRARALPGS